MGLGACTLVHTGRVEVDSPHAGRVVPGPVRRSGRVAGNLATAAIVALVSGLVLTLTAGAMRTVTAADRYVESTGVTADTTLEQFDGPPRTAEIGRCRGSIRSRRRRSCSAGCSPRALSRLRPWRSRKPAASPSRASSSPGRAKASAKTSSRAETPIPSHRASSSRQRRSWLSTEPRSATGSRWSRSHRSRRKPLASTCQRLTVRHSTPRSSGSSEDPTSWRRTTRS